MPTCDRKPLSHMFVYIVKLFIQLVHAHVCVDDTLVKFRGRCKFKMDLPPKTCDYDLNFKRV